MPYGRGIALAGLMAGLLGMAPGVAMPGVAQVVAQTGKPHKAEEDRVLQQCRQDLQKNQYEAAVKSCNQAVVAFRQLKNLVGEVKALNNVGVAYNSLGNYPQAIAYHEQSLAIVRTLKDRQGEARSFENLGVAYNSLGNYPQAIASSEQSLTIARELNDRVGESRLLINLSQSHLGQGNRTKAVAIGQQAIAIAKALNNPELEKLALQALDAAQKPQNSVAPASRYTIDSPASQYTIDANFRLPLPHAQKPANSATPASPQEAEAERLFQQGTQQFQISQFEAALQSWQQALKLYRELKDNRGEGVALNGLGKAYRSLRNYTEAIEHEERSLAIFRSLKDRQGEGSSLNSLGNSHFALGNYAKAVEYQEQSLEIFRALKDRQGERTVLINLASAYDRLDNYAKVIAYQEQNLEIARELKDRPGEALALRKLGSAYDSLSQYEKAIAYYEQALPIFQQVKDRNSEALALRNLGNAYDSLSQYEKAIAYNEQSLAIVRELKDRQGEGRSLRNLGSAYYSLSQYEKAIAYYEQAQPIYQQLKDRKGEANVLNRLGLAYSSLSQVEKAIASYEQALPIFQQVKDRDGEASVLTNLGSAYVFLSQYGKAIASYEQALPIFQQVKDRDGEASVLANLGSTYVFLSQYGKAIAYFEQAQLIYQQVKDRKSEAAVLMNLGNAYTSLYQVAKAIGYYEQARLIFQKNKDRKSEAMVLANLGSAYNYLTQYEKAIAYYEQALPIFQQVKDRNSEASVLMNLGSAYRSLSRYEKAIAYFEQARLISQKNKDRNSEASVLANLGIAYGSLSQYEKTIAYFEQALPIFQQVKDRAGEGKIFAYLGALFEQRQEPELAIVFYKQSVSVQETIRQDIRKLPRESQEAYTQAVAMIYRRLADLLIAQGRIGEAQQVLERLKLQELNDFTKGTRAPTPVAAVGFSPAETQVKSKYSGLIAFGGKYHDCDQQQPRCPQYSELKTQYQNLSKEFQAFVETIKQQLRDSRLTQVDKSTQDFQTSANRVVTAHPNSILIYPLVLPDKTRLLWASKGGALSKAATCPLGEKALYSKVSQFQTLISKRGDETQLKAVGKELYDCLVKPIESELTANGIQHLIFVPDRATNYIPMGALHDGNQYLIQRFAISTVLSASLTDTDSRLSSPAATPVLALGLSQAKGNYGPLPNVEAELSAIVKNKQANTNGIYPGTIFLNQQFTKDALEDNIRGHKIIHIATHGEFKPENPRSSYFLLGNGTPYPIPDVQALRDLKGVDLVVLSACKTGLGGADGLGLEVSGISSFFMGDRDRAKAVMASLWDVNDTSTSLLMQQFYQNLAQGMGKAAALKQAQLSLLQGNLTAKDAPTRSGDAGITVTAALGARTPSAANFSHPYYWAPFILIGNSQ